MNKTLLKFQELSFNTKIFIVTGIFALFIGLIFSVGIILQSLSQDQENIDDAIYNTPTPTVIDENAVDYSGDGDELNIPQYVTDNYIDIENFLNTATPAICNRTYGEPDESITNRLSAYILDPSSKIDILRAKQLTESCDVLLGVEYKSFDENTKTITYSSVMIQNFVVLEDKDLPEEQRMTGKKYVNYRFDIQKQQDGTWKILAINGI